MQRQLLSNTRAHTRDISMPSAEFEPATPATERPQNYALDRAATGTGLIRHCPNSFPHSVSHWHRLNQSFSLFSVFTQTRTHSDYVNRLPQLTVHDSNFYIPSHWLAIIAAHPLSHSLPLDQPLISDTHSKCQSIKQLRTALKQEPKQISSLKCLYLQPILEHNKMSSWHSNLIRI